MPARPEAKHAFSLELICVLMGITGLVAYAMSKFSSQKIVVIITVVAILGFLLALVGLARQRKSRGGKVRAVAICVLTAIAGAYLVLFIIFAFFQDTIANQTAAFFQRHPLSLQDAQALNTANVEELVFTAADGAVLRGWLVRNSQEAKSPLVIYFDGSGSKTWEMVPFAQKLDGWSMALVPYRGFGQSEGTPTQANAFNDAALIFDTFAGRPDIDPTRIVSAGYSLGTGIAVYLSKQRPTVGTILVAPFDRTIIPGIRPSPIFAPLSAILKPYFDSASRAPAIRSPMLCLIGSADQAVPNERSLKLVSQWAGETVVKTYPNEDHGLLLHNNGSWADIRAFLRRFERN